MKKTRATAHRCVICVNDATHKGSNIHVRKGRIYTVRAILEVEAGRLLLQVNGSDTFLDARRFSEVNDANLDQFRAMLTRGQPWGEARP